jgi:hypothetical protein
MLPRPDAQSFTKFLISVGAFLCIAAFVGPGLALRDTGVLQIPERRLAEYTPTARAELLHRQGIARDVGEYAPVVAAALFLGGLVSIGFGLPGLRRQERMDQQRSSAELDKLRSELEPQTEAEQRERLDQDVEQELRAPAQAPASPSPQADVVRPPAFDRSAMVRRASEVEAQVLDRLRKIADSRYEVFGQVKLPADSASFDAVLAAKDEDEADIVVEIKYSAKTSALGSITRIRINEASATLVLYEARTRRRAIAWLIWVTDEADDVERLRERANRIALRFVGRVRVSVVGSDEIAGLDLPPFSMTKDVSRG